MKRVFFTIILVIFTSLYLPGSVHAASATSSASTPWVDTGYAESLKAALFGDVNAAAHVSNVNTNTYADFTRRVLGPVEGITVTAADMNTPYAEQMRQQSAVATLNNYIAMLYTTPPASSYAFIQDVGQTLGFMPKQAYAQGIGFSSLSSILRVWKVFRNIAYALLAIILIVVGFLVMFRKKIDPKTVVTVQSALPKIVITLILITFSYAIVGLMIDLMYVAIYLIISLMTSAVPEAFAGQNVANQYINAGFGKVGLFSLVGTASSDVAKLITSWPILTGAASGLVSVFADIAVLFVWIRILIMLVTAYVQIIISLIISPVQFLLDAVPGSQGGFAAWIKNLLSNLLVYPITILMMLVGTILVEIGKTSGKLWTPPFLGTEADAGGVTGLLALGVMTTIPSIVKGIQESLKAKSAVNIGVGGVVGPIATGASQVGNFIYQQRMLKAWKGQEDKAAPTPSTPSITNTK